MVVIILVLTQLTSTEAATASIGVNYGRVADNLPPSNQVVQLLIAQDIDKVKIYDANPEFLHAVANSGIKVMIMVPNELIQSVASDPTQAQSWINTNVLPYLPSVNITTIMVGNEVLTHADPSLTPLLLPAMTNLHGALQSAGLAQSVKITTPHALDVLDPSSSFPPSSGAFQQSVASSVMQPMLDFLAETGSFFMIDLYPYFAYKADGGQHISLEYALFEGNASSAQVDPNTGLRYFSLFDAQLDAVYSAMSKLNHSTMEVVVSETGWPSGGGPDDLGATVENAAAYNGNLLRHVLARPPIGTPLRSGVAFDTYIFELFNEDLKIGDPIERNFGLFYPNMTEVIAVKLSEQSNTQSNSNAWDIINAAPSKKLSFFMGAYVWICLAFFLWSMELDAYIPWQDDLINLTLQHHQ